jgi:hypothetical protein
VTFLVSPVACGIARALRVRCDGAGKGYAVTHGATQGLASIASVKAASQGLEPQARDLSVLAGVPGTELLLASDSGGSGGSARRLAV